LLQGTGELWQLTPSVFVRAQRQPTDGQETAVPDTTDLCQIFRCPSCEQSRWNRSETEMLCLSCGARWAIDDGIYDLRTPAQEHNHGSCYGNWGLPKWANDDIIYT
jgi:hypothetical protein